ncbi:energy-coupling factor ABC transporter permease [Paraglaciecola sp. L3A3]|uniref:energy-coupling factor ABC transporter permease n=1 Tax=Paraglaciecola sp. L3A3 TaxID=2686358 RepID=UPI00131AF862|nr:energy-coupling factor ABC transporter permease [Paraglaciecola sp. L3A3]
MENTVQFSTIQLIASIISLIVAYLLFKNLPLTQLKVNKKLQHLVFGCCASVFILWMFRTGIYEGLTVHFLWLAALPLILGFRWAMFSACLVLLGVTLTGEENVNMLGVNFLLGVLLPISITYGIYSFTFHKLPRNIFIYIFLCAFIPGALTIALKMMALSGYYYLDGVYDWPTIHDNYFIITSLMLFPEAMFNGMTITILVIHKPHWVCTFHDKLYLKNNHTP